MSLRSAADRYDLDPADLLPLQLEAANERLQERIDQIPLLRNRAQSASTTKIAERSDVVPLLFAHSAYKSYSEAWLTDERWDRMAKWIRTVSTYPVDGLDLDGVSGLDDFVKRLETVGYYVTCSSGTTGKPAMIACSKMDMEIAAQVNVEGFSWATGVVPEGDRKFFGLGPRLNIERNEYTRLAMIDAYSSRADAYQLPLEPITVGSIMAMVSLRRRIGEGKAHPSEVAAFENVSGERQTAMDAAIAKAIDEVIASRDRKLLLTGMFASLYQIAEGVRSKGFSGSDFQDDTALLVGGGLKGTALPDNYREYIFETFNISESRVYHFYSMQEINSPFPKCHAGRYHIPPWVMFLPLDEPGEKLLVGPDEATTGRAAFFDISLDGRWGGVISGDRVSYEFGQCACGHQGPTVGDDIVRYADLTGGDKISCAGTIDAYVRGEG
jgi:hypothetical protein